MKIIYATISKTGKRSNNEGDKSPEETLDVIDFLCVKNGDDNYTAIFTRIEE